jgi:hypothetical protein
MRLPDLGRPLHLRTTPVLCPGSHPPPENSALHGKCFGPVHGFLGPVGPMRRAGRACGTHPCVHETAPSATGTHVCIAETQRVAPLACSQAQRVGSLTASAVFTAPHTPLATAPQSPHPHHLDCTARAQGCCPCPPSCRPPPLSPPLQSRMLASCKPASAGGPSIPSICAAKP